MHLGEAVTTSPTVGSNVEQIQFKNLTFEASTERLSPATICRLAQCAMCIPAEHAEPLCRDSAHHVCMRLCQPTIHSTPGCFASWTSHSKPAKPVFLQVWDLGGQANLRPSWQTYYKNTDAVIVVVDSTDRGRIGIAKVWAASLHPPMCKACIAIVPQSEGPHSNISPARPCQGPIFQARQAPSSAPENTSCA